MIAKSKAHHDSQIKTMFTRLFKNRFIRFVVVGVMNTGFSYCVYAFYLLLGLNYATANFLAMALGTIFSFKTQGTLVFQNSNGRLYFRFLMAWVTIYIANIVLIGEIISLGFDAFRAGILALPPIVVLSYFVQMLLVFKTPKPHWIST